MPPLSARETVTGDGLRAIRLEAGDLRVETLPELGGKVLSIFNEAIGREFLWRDPAVPLRRFPPGTSFDDRFIGGFDELLPNDAAERLDGRDLPDHGELWTAAAGARVEGGAVVLEAELPVSGLRWRRRMEIEPPDGLRLEWRIENGGDRPAIFQWKLHPALRISPGARIAVPARTAEVGDPAWSRFRGTFRWPDGLDAAGRPDRADVVPPFDPPAAEFLYILDLVRGEAAIVHEEEGWALRLEFPPEVFPAVQVFASYGGWRGHEVLVLEPTTSWPVSLAGAAARGRTRRLAPGERLAATARLRAGRI